MLSRDSGTATTAARKATKDVSMAFAEASADSSSLCSRCCKRKRTIFGGVVALSASAIRLDGLFVNVVSSLVRITRPAIRPSAAYAIGGIGMCNKSAHSLAVVGGPD